jgi:hypothetical protein
MTGTRKRWLAHHRRDLQDLRPGDHGVFRLVDGNRITGTVKRRARRVLVIWLVSGGNVTKRLSDVEGFDPLRRTMETRRAGQPKVLPGRIRIVSGGLPTLGRRR